MCTVDLALAAKHSLLLVDIKTSVVPGGNKYLGLVLRVLGVLDYGAINDLQTLDSIHWIAYLFVSQTLGELRPAPLPRLWPRPPWCCPSAI